MRQIITSDKNITFIDVDGKTKVVPMNQVWYHINEDTITFLLIERYDSEGICLFTTLAEDLKINGSTYTIEQLKNGQGISSMFSPTGLIIKLVDELPASGDDSTIYLMANDKGSYTEYFWIKEKNKWEELGDLTKIDLTNYFTKAEINTMFAGVYTKSEVDVLFSDVYSKTDIDNALVLKADAADVYTKTEVDDALDDKQDVLTAGENITIENNVISATGGGEYTAGAGIVINNHTISVKGGDVINDVSYSMSGYENTDLIYKKNNGDWKSLFRFAKINNGPTVVPYYESRPSYNLTTTSEFNTHTGDTVSHTTQAEKDAWNAKQDELTAGEGITIENGVISASGGSAEETDPVFTTWENAETLVAGSNSVGSGSGKIVFGNNNKCYSEVYGFGIALGNNVTNGRDFIGIGRSISGGNRYSIGIGTDITMRGNDGSGFVNIALGNILTIADHYGQKYCINIGNGTSLVNDYEIALGFYANSKTGSTDADKTHFSVASKNSGQTSRNNAFEIRNNDDIYIWNTDHTEMIKLQDYLGGGGSQPTYDSENEELVF